MKSSDTDSIVAIIAAHEDWDEPHARAYFDGYFARRSESDTSRERNFVAEIDGAAVGVIGFGPPPFPTEDVLWGTWYYVDEDHRGDKVGKALMTHALDAIRALGVRKVYLDTASSDLYARAVEFYESFGFRHEGELNDYFDDGEHLVVMGLQL